VGVLERGRLDLGMWMRPKAWFMSTRKTKELAKG